MVSDYSNPYALTALEQQVVDMLMTGMSGKEVASQLRIDRRDVALLRTRAKQKCGARNWLHLAHLVETTRPRHVPDDCLFLEDYQSAFAA